MESKTIAIKRSIIDEAIETVPLYRIDEETADCLKRMADAKDRDEWDMLLDTANKLQMKLMD